MQVIRKDTILECRKYKRRDCAICKMALSTALLRQEWRGIYYSIPVCEAHLTKIMHKGLSPTYTITRFIDWKK